MATNIFSKIRNDISYNSDYPLIELYSDLFDGQTFRNNQDLIDALNDLENALRDGPSPEFYDEDAYDHGNWSDDVDAQARITACVKSLCMVWEDEYGHLLPAVKMFAPLFDARLIEVPMFGRQFTDN